MFSLDSFYYILYTNLLEPVKFNCHYFYPFGSTKTENLICNFTSSHLHRNFQYCRREVLFYDQEPLIPQHVNDLDRPQMLSRKNCKLLANSEHSQFKKDFCRENHFIDWYFFFHGFAALSWYRNFEYYPPIRKFTKVFITFNNLFVEKRSYRLNLVARLLSKDLAQHGHRGDGCASPSQPMDEIGQLLAHRRGRRWLTVRAGHHRDVGKIMRHRPVEEVVEEIERRRIRRFFLKTRCEITRCA